jgi:nitrogen regulatory protein P-II 1
MKKVEAIVQPFKLIEVKEALAELGVTTLTVSEVRGADRGGRHTETYRGQEYVVDFTPRLKVDIVVPDTRVDEVIAVISRVAKTGHDDAGSIFVSSLEDAVSIPSGRHGDVQSHNGRR